METTSFWKQNQAYFWTLLGFAIVGTAFVGFMMIMDWGYLFGFLLDVATNGKLDGILQESTSHSAYMKDHVFGPAYTSIAPEIVRASNERQEYIFYIYLIEILIFAGIYLYYGDKKPKITRPDDLVRVFSPFQLVVIWLNIVVMAYLIVSGFNITWGVRSLGGDVAYFLRWTHEVMGIAWIPIWAALSVIAFKDSRYFSKSRCMSLFLPGKFKPMKRIVYIMFLAGGAGLVISGFLIYWISPHTSIYAETIQFKRALLYVHFGASVVLMFFVLDFVFSTAVMVRGYMQGLLTGKYPREYLEQIDPAILEDLEKR